jgi:hypothetical protein
VITGLVNDEEYQCSISATNDLGTGAESEPFMVVPEALPKGLSVILIKAMLDARKIPD